MARGKTVEKAKILERQALALEFRKQGMPYRKIAQRLNVEVGTAFNDVKNELSLLAALNKESAEDLRQIELDRLDMAIEGIMPFVHSGSAPHATALSNAVEKQAKIAGLIKPIDINITINIEVVQRFEQVARDYGLDPAQALEEYIQAIHEQHQQRSD